MPILNASNSAVTDSQATTSSLPVSEPVGFDTFPAIFQAASGLAGCPVLMLSPLGYEELCGRASWAALADRLGSVGMPSLRFDFPGTGNALDVDAAGLEDWRAAAIAAADELRRRTGQSRIAVLGQGLGATLALQWAADLGPIAATVLLEPAMSGRTYLRGLKAWGRSIAAASGLPVEPSGGDEYAVAGFALPSSRADAIRALDVGKMDAPDATPVLILEQPGGSFGKRMADRGANNITRHDFTGYADLVTDPTSARVPSEAQAKIVGWLSACAHGSTTDERFCMHAGSPQRGARTLRGDGFDERSLRFGRGLAGVLCTPRQAGAEGPAVIIVNAGRDYSIGWARSAVVQARALAREGVASLRFDIGGIGDSRASADAPEEIIYSARMCGDLRAAIDHLDGLGFGPLGLAGRCSGAWAAFTVAVEDDRIQRLALTNTSYFLWDGSENLADVIRFAQRNVSDLGATLLRRNGFRRLMKGELDLRGAWRFLLRQVNLVILRRLAPMLGRLTAGSRRYHDLHALFARLRDRDVRVMLTYGESDTSLNELSSFMGADLRRLAGYPNVSLNRVAGVDHNFTTPDAAAAQLTHMLPFFRTDDPTRAHAGDGRAEAASLTSKPYVLVHP